MAQRLLLSPPRTHPNQQLIGWFLFRSIPSHSLKDFPHSFLSFPLWFLLTLSINLLLSSSALSLPLRWQIFPKTRSIWLFLTSPGQNLLISAISSRGVPNDQTTGVLRNIWLATKAQECEVLLCQQADQEQAQRD